MLSDELHSFRDLAIEATGDAVEFEDDTEPGDESEAEDDEDDHDDQERIQLEDKVTEAAPDDNLVAYFDRIVDELNTLPSLNEELINEEICAWYFPPEISQSTFNGRNGSNACSMISILAAYFFARSRLEIPKGGVLSSEFVKTFCGCIELGNRMYDLCRHGLPNRYLSIEEAAALLSFTDMSTAGPLPVRLEDEHELSTVCGQLGTLSENRTYFASIVIDEKTSIFILSPPHVLYIDSHLHGIYGAVVVKGTYSNLSDFCKFVWKLESHGKSTYGNLHILIF